MEVHVRAMAAPLVAVLLAVMMMAVAVEARPPAKDLKLKASCDTFEDYVYPYWSFRNQPAELSVGYTYSVVGVAAIFGETKLKPEYDETNIDTYYVRLGDDGATYVAVTESTKSGNLTTGSTVCIYNTDSQSVLTWRQEGTDEYFLIEKETSSITDGSPFRFLVAEDVNLPCPLLYPPPECQAYVVVSDLSTSATFSSSSYSGLKAYEEDDITYIQAASTGSIGDLPLVLVKDSSSTFSAMPFPKIRSVTAPEK